MNKFKKHPVIPFKVDQDNSLLDVVEKMGNCSFQGRNLSIALDIWDKMLDDKCTIFFGLSGAMAAAGMRLIVTYLIETRYIDCLVSTGANISEDIVEAMGASYWKGSHLADDNALFQAEINRYYDVYGHEQDYANMTDLIVDCIKNLDSKYPYSTREFLAELGKFSMFLPAPGAGALCSHFLQQLPEFPDTLFQGQLDLLHKQPLGMQPLVHVERIGHRAEPVVRDDELHGVLPDKLTELPHRRIQPGIDLLHFCLVAPERADL